MRIRRMAVFAFVIVSVCALLGAVEFALAAHTSTRDNNPATVGSGEPGIPFTLSITNDALSTHNIDTVRIDADANIDITDADPPTDWTVTFKTGGTNNYVIWSSNPNEIAPSGSQDFIWYADAPTVGSPITYYHTVTTTDTNSQTDIDPDVSTTVDPAFPEFPLGLAAVFVAGLLVYIFLGRLQ